MIGLVRTDPRMKAVPDSAALSFINRSNLNESDMKIEKFKNQLIAFDFDNEMVNATDMIKSFPEKRINNFLRNQQTKDFIRVLESDTLISATIIKQGGTEQGTWMHKLLAYKFAAWLSAEFELFVYKTFDNVLREELNYKQIQLDYFWDKQDQEDLYRR